MAKAIEGVAWGTTSACAENTCGGGTSCRRHGNYLRVRGEYNGLVAASLPCRELPPRARRIPQTTNIISADRGTTSACAENTRTQRSDQAKPWNYLRVRGEYTTVSP